MTTMKSPRSLQTASLIAIPMPPLPPPAPPRRRGRLARLALALVLAALAGSIFGWQLVARSAPAGDGAAGQGDQEGRMGLGGPRRPDAPSPAPSSAPSHSPRPSHSPAPVADPLGTKPWRWKTYSGNQYVPIALYFPPDWTVDESKAQGEGRVYFFAPGVASPDADKVWVVIGTGGKEAAGANPDTLRDAYYHSEFDRMARVGIQSAGTGTWSNGIAFATLTVAYLPSAAATENCYAAVAVGLREGYSWRYRTNAPYATATANNDRYFTPMLSSLNIYGNP